jgi:hypothetical protein
MTQDIESEPSTEPFEHRRRETYDGSIMTFAVSGRLPRRWYDRICFLTFKGQQ